MGPLTNDMTRLSDEIYALHNSRDAFISGLKHNVVEIQADVAEMQAGFRDAHAQMAEETKANMERFVSGVKGAVEGLRKDAVEMQYAFRNTHADMAKRTKANRLAFISGLKQDVATMVAGFRDGQAAYRVDYAETARRARADRRAFVSGLREDVIKIQTDFRDAQARMNKNLRSELSTFISGVKEFVSDIKATVQNLRNDFVADITGARKAWSGLTSTKRRGKKRQEEPEPMVEEIRAREEVEQLAIDDLTMIQGIGQGMQQRLNNAGIHNLAQLATSTPEDLRRTLGKVGPIANVEKWIDEARKLANLS